ncbi:MAG: sigma-54 dependent transcriptional regulator [Bermanella sp.]
MAKPINILCIDDEPSVLKTYQRVFRDSQAYSLTVMQDLRTYDLKQALAFDVIVCDQRMPGLLGSEVFKRLCGLGFQGSKIICSAYADFDDIIPTFNHGFIDFFLNKPWGNDEIRRLVNKLHEPGQREQLIIHDKMEKVYQLALKAAKTNISVYIQGETGTGKELLTRYIHNNSDRLDGPYITVNCATLTTELFESLMFGHKKGAFTGANENHMGFYQAAHGGTLFLDEVVDIPLEAQAKILRALQEKTITLLGETHDVTVDVRVISASAKPLSVAVKEGRFREDLMYRLNVYPIHIPPLRERRNEIELLFSQFMARFNYHPEWPKISCDEKVKKILHQYPWPGNIRELENVCNFLCATLEQPRVQGEDLPEYLLQGEGRAPQQLPDSSEATLSIEQALRQCDQNKSRAAKLLGISRQTLWRYLKNNNLPS